uniref:Short-chain collagen C4 n=1 Tax=Magallana gigas TaxID=29159 RepID=A0A8W8M0W1_MAGGI
MLAKYNTLLTKSNVGGIFVRWGRKDCPGNNTELVYSGFAGGSYYSHTGATAEFVCLPRDPDLTTKFSSGYAYMYGSEYDTTEFGHADGDDLPCSVCRSTVESSVLMIPAGAVFIRWGRKDCPENNTELVYSGFAGGSWPNHKGAAAEFVCLPRDPDLTTKFTSSVAFMYGSEYDVPTTDFGHANGDDLPCSVCRSTVQSSVLMIPEKRILLDDPAFLQSQIHDLERKMEDVVARNTDLTAKYTDLSVKYNTLLTKSNGGGIFVRWGRKDCPGINTELVYSGFAGGSWPQHTGAAAEFVCLPRDPDLTTKFTSSYAFMYGSEYDASSTEFGHDNGDDLPCSVCRSTVQSSVLMIPGRFENSNATLTPVVI